jgi:beta-glucosidase
MPSAAGGEPRPRLESHEVTVTEQPLSFPRQFLFGAATAAYQVEGAAHEDGRVDSIWDAFCRLPGKVKHGDTGDIACDHYHRFDEDLDLISRLGLQAYRFSIAWPRVMPDAMGKPNQKGVDHYRRLVDGLQSRGVVAMATLYHWDLPQQLQDKGGWLSRETAQRFAEYAMNMAEVFKTDIPLWVTLNEPRCSSFIGHLEGRHAPGLTDLSAALVSAHHLLLAHGLAVQALRAAGVTGQIGIALNPSHVVPATERPEDVAAARRVDGNENRWFLDPLFKGGYPEDMVAWYAQRADLTALRQDDFDVIKAPIDYLGINYYQRNVVSAGDGIHGEYTQPSEDPLTPAGLAIKADGLLQLLRRVHSDYTKLPIYITEIGVAIGDYVDPEGGVDDLERIAYLDAMLRSTHAAIGTGVDVRGCFVWALMDNLEWADGYSRRYGIVYVDFGTQTRIPKASARWYQDLIKAERRSN